jgi:hypothetical protein
VLAKRLVVVLLAEIPAVAVAVVRERNQQIHLELTIMVLAAMEEEGKEMTVGVNEVVVFGLLSSFLPLAASVPLLVFLVLPFFFPPPVFFVLP